MCGCRVRPSQTTDMKRWDKLVDQFCDVHAHIRYRYCPSVLTIHRAVDDERETEPLEVERVHGEDQPAVE